MAQLLRQAVDILVKETYQPNIIRVRQGIPVRLKFNRQEAIDCSNRVLIPDFGISRALPVLQTTTITFTPETPGGYPFTCWMNTYRGTIIVEPNGRRPVAPSLTERAPEDVAPCADTATGGSAPWHPMITPMTVNIANAFGHAPKRRWNLNIV